MTGSREIDDLCEAAAQAVSAIREFALKASGIQSDGSRPAVADMTAMEALYVRVAAQMLLEASLRSEDDGHVEELCAALRCIFGTRSSDVLSTAPDHASTCQVWQPLRAVGRFTQRERSVTLLVASGMTNQEIADELYITTKTVEFHLANIFNKLGIRSRAELRKILRIQTYTASSMQRAPFQ
ncbi:LuxR C-terminal-related transcriptional regulator [Streptomyces sp. NPDC085932]|uniref:helix-turn-helix transcriptional regulator n=1 Tax=Streptomyces sp. NPDC085932 TaxID=3365741 RepID=UPI0037D9478E